MPWPRATPFLNKCERKLRQTSGTCTLFLVSRISNLMFQIYLDFFLLDAMYVSRINRTVRGKDLMMGSP